MKAIDQLENKVADWVKPLPHLPLNVKKWLAENIWWIVLLGAIFSILGIVTLIGAIFTASSLIGVITSFNGNYMYNSYTGWSVAVSVVSVIFMIAMAVLAIMAFNPLKQMQKKGWELLFLMQVVAAVDIVVNSFMTLNLFSLISGVIGIAIGAYFLYEIRSYFVMVSKNISDKK